MFRWLQHALVRFKLRPIPVGSRVQYKSKWDGALGPVGEVVEYDPVDNSYKLEFPGGLEWLSRRNLVLLALPPRLSPFEQRVQSYIKSELPQ